MSASELQNISNQLLGLSDIKTDKKNKMLLIKQLLKERIRQIDDIAEICKKSIGNDTETSNIEVANIFEIFKQLRMDELRVMQSLLLENGPTFECLHGYIQKLSELRRKEAEVIVNNVQNSMMRAKREKRKNSERQ